MKSVSNDCIDHGCAGTQGGYAHVRRTVFGKVLRVAKHRLAYCEANGVSLESIDGLIIRHTCDNPRCINPAHLIVGTQQDNINDMVERRRNSVGEHRPLHKLTAEQVATLRQERKSGATCRALAARYGISPTTVSRIARGVNWQCVA